MNVGLKIVDTRITTDANNQDIFDFSSLPISLRPVLRAKTEKVIIKKKLKIPGILSINFPDIRLPK